MSSEDFATPATIARSASLFVIFDSECLIPSGVVMSTRGVAVFSGMIGVTFFGLLLTPVFYVLIRAFVEKREARKAARLQEVHA